MFFLQHIQVNQAKFGISLLLSYALVKLISFLSSNSRMNAIQELFFYMVYTYPLRSLPFACMSSSMSKPTPLQLDVSLPSLQDIRWNFSRLIYLFNMQLERNVAT